MDPQGQLVRLRSLRDSDLDDLHAYVSDLDVTRFTTWSSTSLEETQVALETAIATTKGQSRDLALAITTVGADVLIGVITRPKPDQPRFAPSKECWCDSQWRVFRRTRCSGRPTDPASRPCSRIPNQDQLPTVQTVGGCGGRATD